MSAAANTAADLEKEIVKLRLIGRTLVRYARWQINEGADHHPTLPSAVAEGERAFGCGPPLRTRGGVAPSPDRTGADRSSPRARA